MSVGSSRLRPWTENSRAEAAGTQARPASRQRDHTVALLTVWMGLTMLLMAHLVVGPIGAAGTPSILFGLGLGVLWVIGHAHPAATLYRAPQPARWGLYAWVLLATLTYGLAWARPLTQLEGSGADRSMIMLLSLVGTALFTMDALAAREDLERLLRRFVGFATVVAAIGLLQFVFGWNIVESLPYPGLTENQEIHALKERSLFGRPYSTTRQPIELGVVLAMALPFALNRALAAPADKRTRRWLILGVLALSLVTTVSRSGIIAAAVGLMPLFLTWDWRRRLNLAVLGMLFLVGVRILVPGLVGTIRSLFLQAPDDPSITGRTEDIAYVMDLVRQRPWLGHGFGVYSPEEYQLLDNQWYETAVEGGLIGLAVLVFFLACAVFTARAAARGADAETAATAQALAGALLGATVSLTFFDGFTFNMFMGVLYMLIGAAGALWRFRYATPVAAGSPGRREPQTS